MNWTANWIWHPPLENMDNLYLYARKEVALASVPTAVTVAVTAGSMYKLYINGEYVGRGPNPSDPSRYYYDTYDVTGLLRAGTNVVAAVCYNYGEKTQGMIGQNWGRGAFLLEMRAGDTVLASSDGTWQVLKAEAWDQNASLNCNFFGDFKEVYDSRREIDGWMLAGFDGSAWLAPEVLGPPPILPYTRLVEREIPALGGEVVYPENTYWESASLTYSWRDDWEVYHDEQLNGDAYARGNRRPVEITKTHADFSPSIICDFGRDVTGYPEISIHDSAGGVIDVMYGEDLHMVRVDTFILKGGPQTLQAYNRRTFRYLKLVFQDTPGRILLDEVSVQMNTYPVEYTASFTCSDRLLTRIWEVGRYTMHMSMLDHFVDCPWRERTIYGGDVYAENLISYAAFGDPKLNRKTLRQMFALQYPEGALPPYGPYNGVNSFYPSWTGFFGLAFVDHFDLTGDKEFLEEGWPHLSKLLEWTIGQLENNRLYLIGDPSHGGKFPEWMANEKDHFLAWSTLPFYRLLQHSARIAEDTLGLTNDAARYRKAAAGMAEAMLTHCVNPDNGHWDGEGSKRQQKSSQYDNGFLMWCGALPPALHSAAARHFATPETRPIGTPFEGLFMLMGLFTAGEDVAALNFIREYWGELLARGATTFWEHFNVESPANQQAGRGASLCHGWSAGPTYALPSYVLGVTPAKPGFTEVAIAPQPGDLSWARGAVPTPHGLVKVEWTRNAEEFRLCITLPAGTTGRVCLPRLFAKVCVTVDGACMEAAGELMIAAGEHEIVAKSV